jgi:energy-coupling factor transporter ATP-binding protein EcfA2
MLDYHELERELEDQLARTAQFRRMAFHVHSPDSHDWGREADREKNNRMRFEGRDGMDVYLDELAEHVDIACITDHMKSGLACELSQRVERRDDLNLVVFPGVEVSCLVPPGHADAIHVLVVFRPGTSVDVIERIFARQIDLPAHDERTGHEEISVDSLAKWGEQITEAGALFVFAHVEQPQRGHRAYVRRRRGESMEMMSGNLDGYTERAISHEYAEHLVALAPSAVEVKEGGADREHYAKFTTADGRVHKVAAVARSDLHAVEEFASEEAITHVKVSRPDLECVRDALRFFSTRIRFEDDLPEAPSPRIVGLRLRSTGDGLFDDATLAFNENLNCLIGPRGCGKSTIVEALRYVLGKSPELEDAAHGEGPESSFAQLALNTKDANLKDTQIELIYEVADGQRLLIGATYDEAESVTSRIFTLDGEDRHVGADVLTAEFPARIFSWSEIETLGRRPRLQRQLIDRLAEALPAHLGQRDAAHLTLVENREDIGRLVAELRGLLAADNGALRRHEEYKIAFGLLNTDEVQELFAGLDTTRERVELLETVSEYLEDLAGQVEDLESVFEDDPTEKLLKSAGDPLREWFEGSPGSMLRLGELADAGRQRLEAVAQEVGRRREALGEELQRQRGEFDRRETELREKTNAEPGESIRREQREEARHRYQTATANRQRYQQAHGRLREALNQRRKLARVLKEAEDAIAEARRQTAEALSERLASLEATDSRITIDVDPRADRSALVSHYDGFLNIERGGHYREKGLADRLASLEPASVVTAILASDSDALVGDGALDDADARRLVSAFELFSHDGGADVEVVDDSLLEVLQIEEQKVDDTVKILSDDTPVDTLSPGGRSSAMLPLIAMADTVPLIIDQPEDNLDNRMVGRTLTSILAKLKERRQIIVTTHNPNIVVGGDAEQVLVLDAPHAREALVEEIGSIDDDAIIEHVIRIMEGGKEAFEERELRYEGHLG